MALGDNGRSNNYGSNNNNGNGDSGNSKKLYENTYYSRVKIKNYESKLVIGFKFRSGMLNIDVSQEKENFQYESIFDMMVTYTKAKVLLNMIDLYKKDVASGIANPEHGYGIESGMGDTKSVLIIRPTESNGTAITFGKVTLDGNFTDRVDVELNTHDFHFGLEWNDISAMKISKVYQNETDLDIFEDVLKQFVNNATGAAGYFVADTTRYDYRAIMNKMNPIYDKLGIPRNNGGNGGNRQQSGGYFDKIPATSNHKSFDEMEEDLPFD